MLICFNKKIRHWSKHVKEVEHQVHFENKLVGCQDALPGVFSNVPSRIIELKEPDYTMLMKCTHGSIVIFDRARENVRIVGDTRASFKHSENSGNHFQYRNAIDNHNSKRHDGNTHDGIGLENSWNTIRWSIRVFSFMIAVTLFNSYLFFICFNDRNENIVQHYKLLSHEMCFNALNSSK